MKSIMPRPRDGRGYIYFIEAGGFIKIGWSLRKPTGRLHILQTGCPHKMRLIGYRVGSQYAEYRIHRRFSAWRYRGEWYHASEPVLAYAGWAHKSKQLPTIKSPNTGDYVIGNWLF